MPLYEYKCDRCGDVFEVIQKFVDTPLEQHEGCGGHVERLISRSALKFKGTGWYVTDYAKGTNNGKVGDKRENKDNGKDGGKDSGKDGAKESSKESGKDSSAGAAKTETSTTPSKPAASSTTTEKK